MLPSGVTARRDRMNTLNQTTAKSASSLMSILFVALLGGVLLFVAGHAQSGTLHDAAHDVRHATGFPCH
jgi:cobalt transporter subunit CbtB